MLLETEDSLYQRLMAFIGQFPPFQHSAGAGAGGETGEGTRGFTGGRGGGVYPCQEYRFL